MKTTLKSRLRSIIILGFIVVASLLISMWQLFGLHGISAGAAYTQATGIATAMSEAASDWKTKTDIEVGDETNQNGSVVTINSSIVSSIVVPTGAQVTIDSVEPSVQRELENDATYSQLIFNVPVTVSAESVLTINTDVVFRGGVNVYGTLIIGGMAFNQSSMLIANKPNSYAEIDSQGVIVKGSLNNDAARNGSININAGATLTIAESTETSYTDADGDKKFFNHDGGALFLKANGTSLGLVVSGNIANGGSIIYESGAAWSGKNVIGDGAIVSAAFISDFDVEDANNNRRQGLFYSLSNTVAVFYDEAGYGTLLDISIEQTGKVNEGFFVERWTAEPISLNEVTLLSFGRTIITSQNDQSYYSLEGEVNFGGGTSGGKTFTQGANELIFDGGAQWKPGNASGYSLSFISGEDASAHTAYRNDGVYSSSALINVSSTLNTYSGVKILHHETRAGSGIGGGIKVNSEATLTMYGGEVAYNAVTMCNNDGAGGGIYQAPGSTVKLYNGLVTRNSLANYNNDSADGAGIAVDGGNGVSSELFMFGGEVSYNCGANGSEADKGADGGGMIARYSSITMYGGFISGNYSGGSGGGMLLWESTLTMSGGEISGNRAGFGGGIGMTSDNNPASRINVSGGTISGNQAFSNSYIGTSGYGGGICVGSEQFPINSYANFSGDAVVSGNNAVYGGGLAVYTEGNVGNRNTLTMSGGTITNNTAQEQRNGSGVYVNSATAISGALLQLSGNATIDSSNNASFSIPTYSSAAPISVSGELTGSGLAALVYLDNPESWTNKNIVSYDSGVTADRNKFLLDSTAYTFYEVTSNVDYLRIQNVENNQDYVASISGKGNYSSLEDAVAAAADGDTITVLRSATISQSMQVSGKNITIVPASGEDITLGVASDFTVTGTGATDVKSLFIVSGGGSLTIGNNEENTKIAFDGNKSSGKDMSMVYVAGGSFTLGENATLRNNNSTGNAGALYLGQDTSATIKGTIADTSGTYGAIYINAGGSIIIDGATFSGNCSDSNGNNYAVYAVGNESTVKLDGEVAFGGNAVYTENKINLGDSFKNGGATIGATIGVTFPAARTAGTTIVEIPQTFVDGWQNAPGEDYESAAQYVSAQFNVVNMDSDYMLILSTQSTTTANALVVSKSVVFVFDFTYSNGFNEGSTQIGISEITFKGIDDVLSQTVAEQFAGRIHTRGNLVVLELQSGSNFPLDEFLGYASRSGHSLISWQVNGTSTKYNYNGNLAYLDSEDEVSVRSVWVENTYNIAFNKNSATFGQGVTFGGRMENQEITSNTQDKITLNAYTLVGYAFTEWNTQSDGEGTTYAIDAVASFSQLTADAPVYEYDSSGIITKAVYNITLYAQWECIFSGGEGTAANPFIINSVKDLYILEATVNGTRVGTESGTDNAYAVPNTYYNTNNAEGIATYLPESYEGYYFKLSDNFDNAASPFKGVIGRISSSGGGSKAHENQEANITAAVYGENVTIGGTGAAAGNPFKGYFDGNGKTIALNINKQKVENYTGAEGYENGDETLVGVGLFGYADHATIRNVNLSGSVHGYAHVGGLVGYAFGGNISNIYTSADVTSGGHDVGGVIGTFYEVAKNYAASSVTDAVNIGSVSYAPRERDNLAEELDIEDNWNELGVMDDAQGVRFGGIVGAGVTLRLTGGYNLGNITARYGIGGVVGTLRSLDNSTTNYSLISQSFNTGEITATAGLYASSTSPNNYVQDFVTAYTGGITGRLVGRSSVNTSFNAGKVTSTYVAKVSDTDSQFEYVGMNGFLDIAAGDSATYIGARGVGGIVGFTSYDPSATSQSGRMSISNVYNTGDVYSFAGVGGIAGYLAFGNISEAFNGGNITAYGTHYDAASQSRVNGGYMLSTGVGGETIYVAYLGAIVGRGINASLTATVSFNMNSTYSGYTDPTVQAVGDSGYNAQFGFGANSSSAKALASSQMRVVTQGTAPSGFDPTFDGGAWSFKMHNDTYSYYPQLSVFADSSEAINVADESGEGFESKNISTISRESARIKYRTTDEEQGEVDKPVEDNKKFKLIFNLGGGSFNFSSTSTDDNGIYSIFTGKHKHYYASGSDYYYLFTFPTDKTDYGTGTEAGGTDELEMPDDPVRTGYTFAGWYIDAGCTQEFNFEAIPGQDTTIYAKWEAVIYTITYENVVGVGGTWSGVYNKTFSILDVNAGRLSFPVAENISRRGYEFTGWIYNGQQKVTSYEVFVDESGNPCIRLITADSNAIVIVFEDLIGGTLALTAEWTASQYTITYTVPKDVELVSGSPVTEQVYTIERQADLLKDYAARGKRFVGWRLVEFDNADARNGELLNAGEIYSTIPLGVVGNIKLEADYEDVNYTLSFYTGSGHIADYESYGLTLDPATGLYNISLKYKAALEENLHQLAAIAGEKGRTFNGWSTNSQSNISVELSEFTMPDSNMMLYAVYEVTQYEITVDLKLKSSGQVIQVDTGKAEELGFTVDGDNFKITVDYGTDLSEQLSQLLACVTLDAGYHFNSWIDSYGNGVNIYNINFEKTTLTIYASYSMDQVTVNVVGFNNDTLKTFQITSGKTLSEEDLDGLDTEVTGYEFIGWKNADGTDFDVSQTFVASATIYAYYEPVEITVEYVIVIGEQEYNAIYVGDTKYYYGKAFGSLPTLSELTIDSQSDSLLLGRKIVSWAAKNGTDVLPVTISTIITDHSGYFLDNGGNFSVKLYATLGYEDYDITFLAGDGAFVGGGQTSRGSYNYGAAEISFPDLADRTGYDHTGWSYYVQNDPTEHIIELQSDETYGEALIRLIKEGGIVSSITVTARWEQQEFEVWYYAAAGDFTVIDTDEGKFYDENGTEVVTSGTAKYFVIKVKYGSSPALSLRPVQKGYSFSSWSHASGIGLVTSDIYTKDSPITASYNVITYTINYVLDGGTFSTAPSYSYTYQSGATLPTPSKAGYTFEGWYLTADFDETSKIENLTGKAENLILYAKWAATKITITLEVIVEGPETELPDDYSKANLEKTLEVTLTEYNYSESALTVTFTVSYGTDLSVLNSLSKSFGNYVPGGWKTSDGSDWYFSLATEGGTYTNTYTAGTTSGVTIEYYYDDRLYTTLYNQTGSAPLFELSREGYTFLGWYSEAGEKYEGTSIDLTVITGTLKVYAHWEENTYTLSLEYNCQIGDESQEVKFGTPLADIDKLQEKPSRAGYLFVGWYSDIGLQISADDMTMPARDIVLYAKWQPVQYQINFHFGDNSSLSAEIMGEYNAEYKLPDADMSYYTYVWLVRAIAEGQDDKSFEYSGRMPILNEVYSGYTRTAEGIVYIDVYAYYTPVTYSVNYVNGDQIFSQLTFNAEGNSEWNELATVTAAEGYVFSGWSLSSSDSTRGVYKYYRVTYQEEKLYLELNSTNGNESGYRLLVVEGEALQPVSLISQFTANTYNVTFNSNYGTVTSTTQSFTYGQSVTLNGNTFSRTGYTFLGWATSTNGEVVYSDKAVISNLQSTGLTLYAKWRPNTYSVLFDANGGTGTDIIEVTYDGHYKLPESEPERTGYKFVGWFTAKDGTGTPVTGDTPFNTAGNVTLYAKWTANSYTVTFNANAGDATGEMQAQSFTYGQSVTLNANKFTKEGYHFLGWATSQKSDKVVYVDGATISNITESSLTLYAVWKANTYTVVFNANGGTGTMDPQSFAYGESKALTANAFDRTGYIFLGWAKTNDATKAEYADKASVDNLTAEDGATVTLYAVWEASGYTVTFDANGEGVTGEMQAQSFTYGQSVTLNANNFEREGYHFLGWATSKESNNVVYADKAEIGSLQSTGLTLFAVWEINTYTVTFNGVNVSGLGNATVNHGSEYTYNLSAVYGYGLPDNVTIVIDGIPLEDGYTYDKASGVITIEAGRITGNVKISASGVIKTYTVSFNSNDGSTVDNITVNHGEKVTAPKAPTKNGYAFAGWYVGDIAYDFNTAVTADVELTAKWNAIEYTISYVLNGGTNADGAVTTFTVESDDITLLTPTREGYSFDGWYNAETGGDKVTVIEAGRVGNITLYARWTVNRYTVAFNGANVSGSGNGEAEHGAIYTYKLSAVNGYSLPGDVTIMIGDNLLEYGYSYDKASGVITIEAGRITDDVVISANGVINTYTVTFDTDGGSEIKSQTVAHGDKAAMPESAPEKDGYKFAGWYVGETEFKFDETEITENITITAKWVINTYTVSFNSDGGSTVEEITVNHGEKVTAPKAPTKDGYAFAGWYVGETAYDFNTAVTADVELTAKWNAIEYTISYVLNGGTNADGAVTTFTVESGEITLLAPTREGYSFDGWYNAETGGDKVTVIEAGSIGNITLYARWTTESHTVSFNSDGGSTVDNITVNHGEKVTAPEAPTKYGYAFAGWYVGDIAYDFNKAVTADVALTAKWNAIEYTISYVLNGGTNADGAVTTFTVESGEITLLAPTREGYSFDGWYNAETGGDKVTVIEAGSIGNITLYARWTTESHTVSFNSDGGSTVDNITVNHGEKVTAPEAPTKYGYAFAGWYVGDIAYDFNKAVTADVALTAKWNAIEYTISYVLNGGMNDGEVITEYTIESDTIVHPVPVRDGYTFLGWFDAEVGGNKSETIESGSTGHVTLYALWRIDSVEVSFEANGGSLDDGAEVQKVDYGNTVAFVEPVRENYLFLGWYTDEALTQSYDFNSAVTQSFTLYAKWRLQQVVGQAPDGTTITVSSDSGFDDGTMLRFTELSDESSISQASGSLTENMTLKRLYDIELVRADGSVVPIEHMLSVGISAEGLGDANGKFVIVYVPDDGGEAQQLATHVGSDGKLYFFIEHFSFYAIVDMTDIVPQAGFAWWWILVAIGGCALIAIIALIIARNNRRYELNYVNGGIPSVKLRESKLIDLPIPERESEVFEGWYYDEDFRDRAFLTSMPKQNLILYAKWRTMTQDERIARDKARAEAAATKKSDDV